MTLRHLAIFGFVFIVNPTSAAPSVRSDFCIVDLEGLAMRSREIIAETFTDALTRKNPIEVDLLKRKSRATIKTPNNPFELEITPIYSGQKYRQTRIRIKTPSGFPKKVLAGMTIYLKIAYHTFVPDDDPDYSYSYNTDRTVKLRTDGNGSTRVNALPLDFSSTKLHFSITRIESDTSPNASIYTDLNDQYRFFQEESGDGDTF